MQNIYDIGFVVLIANAMVAFLLNVSVVFLVSVIFPARGATLLILCRLEKLRLSFLPFVVFLRISC